MIIDSRTKTKNVPVAHSVFTQKFQNGGDPFDHIEEMPTFGYSDNHAGLQIADLFVGLLLPIATRTYGQGVLPAGSVHVDPADDAVRARFGAQNLC